MAEEDAVIEDVEQIDVAAEGKVEDLLDGAERSPLLIAGLLQDHELALKEWQKSAERLVSANFRCGASACSCSIG